MPSESVGDKDFGANSTKVVSRWKCPSCLGEMIYCGVVVKYQSKRKIEYLHKCNICGITVELKYKYPRVIGDIKG